MVHSFRPGAWLMVAFTAAVALSACGSPPPGVLTQSDIPSNLGVKYNPTVSATAARGVRLLPARPPPSMPSPTQGRVSTCL